MDMSAIPDEWLEDIFTYLTYFQQRLRRRTCRRWNALLYSPRRLKNVIYLQCSLNPSADHSSNTPAKLVRRAMRIAAKTVQTVIVTGCEAYGHQCPDADIHAWRSSKAAGPSTNIIDYMSERPSRVPRQLLLINLRIFEVGSTSRYSAIWGMVFQRVIFTNVTFSGQAVISCLQDAAQVEDNIERKAGILFVVDDKKSRYFVYCACRGAPELPINVISGGYTVDFGEAVGMAEPYSWIHQAYYPLLFRLFEENMKPLTAEQTDDLRKRLAVFENQPILVEWITTIFKRFQPDHRVNPGQSLETLELQDLSSLVQQLLFSSQVPDKETPYCCLQEGNQN